MFAHSYSKDKEEEMISDLAAPMTEIEDDVETGVRLTRDIGVQCDPDPLLQENMRFKVGTQTDAGQQMVCFKD